MKSKKGDTRKTVAPGRAIAIVGASGVAAVSSLLVTIIAARSLTVEENKEFLVFWALMFGIFGLSNGVQTEVTRATSAARVTGKKLTKAMPVVLAMGAAIGALVLISSPLWATRMLPTMTYFAVCLIAVGVALNCGQMGLSGSFAGAKLWGYYSGLIASEALTRLVLVLAVAGVLARLWSFEAAIALPALSWLFFLITHNGRRAFRSKADVSASKLVTNVAQTMVSAASWAALVTGFSAMLEVTSPGEDPQILATTMLAVTLTRSPIMMPLQALQGVFISWATESKGSRIRSIIKLFLGLFGLGAFVALLAAAFGPWAMRLLFGDQYSCSAWLLAGLSLASVSMAWLVLSGAVALASNQHRLYALGWVLAAVTTFLLLLALPFDAFVRSLISLAIGPLAGTALQLRAIWESEKM